MLLADLFAYGAQREDSIIVRWVHELLSREDDAENTREGQL